MKKQIKNMIVAGLICISSLIGLTNIARAETKKQIKKPSVIVTRVQNETQKSIDRLEVTGKLPYNLEYYGIAQEQGDSKFYKASAQSLPVKTKHLGLGITGQYVNGNNFPEHKEHGLVARIHAMLNNCFAKLDIKYFPDREEFSEYGFLDTKRFFIDVVGSYNHESQRCYVQPGFDLKVNKTFSAGIETNFSGGISNLDKQYLGIRTKLNF